MWRNIVWHHQRQRRRNHQRRKKIGVKNRRGKRVQKIIMAKQQRGMAYQHLNQNGVSGISENNVIGGAAAKYQHRKRIEPPGIPLACYGA